MPYEQAEARVAAALASGGRLVRDKFAPSWWTNVEPKIQSHRKAWLNHGWKVTEFDQQARLVKFFRERPSTA